jgi:hypothetical protein
VLGTHSSYLTGLLQNLSFPSRYFFLVEPLPEGAMVQLFLSRSDGSTSCTDLLCLDATSVIPPRTIPFLLGTSAWILRPKPGNRPPDGFEAQTIKPSASSVLHTRPLLLDACHRCPRPTGRQVFQSLARLARPPS